jgi:hypothetical protein
MILRHGQGQAVPFDGTDHGQTDPGVAGSGFNHGLVPGKPAGRFPGPDHVQGGPVLDGPARVHVFQFGENPDTGIRIHPPDFHHRGVADGIDD